MNARSLTFASLLFAAAHPVLASDGGPLLTETLGSSGDTPAPMSLTPQWKTSIKNGVLVADLTLVNTGTQAADIVVAYGHSPGPYVRATVDGVELEAVLDNTQMHEQMSRMGPMPRYGAVAAGKDLAIGTFRFKLPAGYAGKSVVLVTRVYGMSSATVESTATLPLAPTAA